MKINIKENKEIKVKIILLISEFYSVTTEVHRPVSLGLGVVA